MSSRTEKPCAWCMESNWFREGLEPEPFYCRNCGRSLSYIKRKGGAIKWKKEKNI